MKRNGISIIEVLIAIAVIAVLTAIVLPGVVAGTASQRVMCLNNIRQLGMGMLMYASDYDGNLPDAFSFASSKGTSAWNITAPRDFTNGGGNVIVLWSDKILPYVKNINLFVCPARPDVYQEPSNVSFGKRSRTLSYGVNMCLCTQYANPPSPTTPPNVGTMVPLSSIPNPENIVLLGEVSDDLGQLSAFGLFQTTAAAAAHEVPSWAFCDGHAASMPTSSLIKPRQMLVPKNNLPITVFTDVCTSEPAFQEKVSSWFGLMNAQLYPGTKN